VIKKNVRNQHVEIICSSFSIGQGPTTLWAEGNAGWFEIKPSADYQKMYTKIAQGVEIYFGIVQVYEDLKKSTKKGWQKALTVEEVLARVRIRLERF
jgi:membrane-associated protease RseP (regulator of RpoE activity)